MLNRVNFYFNEKTTYDLGLILSEYPSIPFLEENTESVEIEGKIDGSLIEDLGTFKDREISCTFKIVDDENYHRRVEEIKRWLRNIKDNRLFIENDKYFLVKNIVGESIALQLDLYGEFTIKFICYPFLYGEEVEKVNVKTIENFGDFKSPIFAEIWGNGNIKISVNDEAMIIENVKEYIKIDTSLKTVIDKNGISKDWDTIGNFPMLQVGTNNISVSNANKVIIKYNELYY